MQSKKKIVIVGGGIIGLCSAYYLQQQGYEVHVLEKGDFDNGCSSGNAGMVVPSHFIPLAAPGMMGLAMKWMFNPESPFSVKPRLDKGLWNWIWQFYRSATAAHVKKAAPVLMALNLESRRLYEDFASFLSFGFQKKGLFMLCKTEKGFKEEQDIAYHAHAMGMEANILSADEAQRMDPGVELDVAGAVHFPMDAHLTPNAFLSALYTHLREKGVVFHHQQSITNIQWEGRQITGVGTDDRLFEADEFVVASGAWSSAMVKSLQANIPMLAGKGYSVMVLEPSVQPSICAIMTEARVTLTPMLHGVRFAGTMEMIPAGNRTMEMVGPDESVNQRRLQGIFKAIPQYYSQFRSQDFNSLKVWSGLRPCSPDGLPYIGKLRHYDNLTIATGHSMMGLSLGPVTGKLVSQVIAGEEPAIDLTLLNPDRFYRSQRSVTARGSFVKNN